ncbi:hypothetical protein A3A93_01595 [Candidatus Roizmanbacteria bacterium RIFCSPLOWO2_01_FULL_38_12]|uniref:DUF2062 domain-containing protein n=1 Tax=Candidatus Roizmanbacteria bacterium RIFCSPLOWO2_01_FULL_38_12 TaxID=1802061 RepID=A0A1F7IYC4_9BACT|nr:MAG: hypothetical protein A2861_02410 [Candidatus Roizmanbacteria bacterium RIFCSPHIGHO2_01_FULL_38_15]OGK34485.1 MAG: hypothetical protein A3F59_04120 [Candidatus Roizmanbacteria bacterium RIFCSPHIGHO2_12_FULL_38_13]OGK48315.1 MAG: hypothetical protein A3A93_01595 [Candidatus Roizmanbacteria bacterium RIFCSPLOWO2_01_FULL_38_12]
MKLEKILIANTLAITTGFAWTICTLAVAFFPAFSFQFTQWLTHGLVLRQMGDVNVTFYGYFMVGIVLVAFAWITGYVFGLVWEVMSKK